MKEDELIYYEIGDRHQSYYTNKKKNKEESEKNGDDGSENSDGKHGIDKRDGN